MTVGGIARYETTTGPIAVRQRKPQIPKTDVLKRYLELSTNRLMQKRLEIEVIRCGTERDRRVHEPGATQVNATQELPVPLQVGVQDVVIGFTGITG